MADRSSRIRICYVLNTFDLGGAESVALNLAKGHDKERFEVEIVGAMDPTTGTEPEMLRRCREVGVSAVSLGQPNLRSPRSLLRFFWYLKRGKFDVVLGHNRGSDYWAVRLGKWAGIRHRYWTRHLVYQDMNQIHLRRYQSIAGQVDGVIAVSESVRLACTDIEQLAGVRIETIENGIDTEQFAPIAPERAREIRQDLGHPSDHLMLLFVGRFCEQKAPEAFVDLMHVLLDRGVRAIGYMCGHGPLAKTLAEKVDEGGKGVRVLGLRRDIPELLGACDLFVSTSRNEGLPLNVMEAMSSGTPFVGPDISQIKELTRFQRVLSAGLFSHPPLNGPVEIELLEAWADTTIDVVSNLDRMKEMGRLGRSVIEEQFSLQKMVARYEKVFMSDGGWELDDK